MAEKILGLLCFMFATSAVTCFHFGQSSFPHTVKNNFQDASSAKRWEGFNLLRASFFQHNGFKRSQHDLLEPSNYNSDLKRIHNLWLRNRNQFTDHSTDFRMLHKVNYQNLWSRNRNYLQQFTNHPSRNLFKPRFDQKTFKGTFNSFDKKAVNVENSDSDSALVTDINYSTKESHMKIEKNPINYSSLSSYTPEKFSLFTDKEVISSVSSKPSIAVSSSTNLKTLDKDDSTEELVTDTNRQVTEKDFISKFVSPLMTKLTSEDGERSKNPEDETFTNTNRQVEDNQRDFTTNTVLPSSENNLVRTNSYSSPLTGDVKVSLGESLSSTSTVEIRQSTILPAETSSSTEKAWTGSGTSDKSSTSYLNPSPSTTDKENPFKYLKSTTVHKVTDYAVKSTSDPLKSKIVQDITNGIHVSTDSTPFRERFVKETIPQDHVITDSTIRAARIAISAIFLSVALMAVAILAIYLLRIRRNTVEYDQLLLLS